MRVGNARKFTVSGFTLIEVMIVVVIIGVLATIAYPSYRSHIIASNRAAAESFMMSVSSRQEQLMLDLRLYVTSPANPPNTPNDLSNIGLSVPSEVSPYYTISVAVNNSATPPSYSIAAARKAGTVQAKDSADLGLDSTGTKTPANLWK